MFRVLDSSASEVEVWLEGKPVTLRSGITLAAALIENGCIAFRVTPVNQTPRAPYCMMGSCFECLVQVDGVNQRACQIKVEAGMRLQRCVFSDSKGSGA